MEEKCSRKKIRTDLTKCCITSPVEADLHFASVQTKPLSCDIIAIHHSLSRPAVWLIEHILYIHTEIHLMLLLLKAVSYYDKSKYELWKGPACQTQCKHSDDVLPLPQLTALVITALEDGVFLIATLLQPASYTTAPISHNSFHPNYNTTNWSLWLCFNDNSCMTAV